MKKTVLLLLLAAVALACGGCFGKANDADKAAQAGLHKTAGGAATGDSATGDSATADEIFEDALAAAQHPMNWKINKVFFSTKLTHRVAQLPATELLQNPELPTGCESVAVTAALHTLEFSPEKTDFAEQYLTYGEDVMWDYVGDPYDYDGAGVFPPGLTNCANNYLAATQRDKYAAYNTMGVEFENLLKLIDNGFPVVLWTTMDYEEPMLGDVAYEYEGEYYYWFEMEHCVLLYGYDLDEGTVMLNDPMQGTVTMDLLQMKTVYDAIGRLSMTIKTKE